MPLIMVGAINIFNPAYSPKGQNKKKKGTFKTKRRSNNPSPNSDTDRCPSM